MKETLRHAIIGIGSSAAGKGGAHSIAYCHAWASAATDGTTLVAACSRTRKNRDDFLEDFPGCRGYADYREMLNEVQPDLVSVCAFAPDREEMVSAALDAGAKGVWIEKPFALSLDAAQRMMEKAKTTGSRLFVNHQRRYGRPFEALQDATTRIGTLQNIDILQPFGHIMDFGSHLIDMALYLAGSGRTATRVFAAVDWSDARTWQGTTTESHSLASIFFDDGLRLTYEAGRMPSTPVPLLRANGSLGFAELQSEPAEDVPNVFRAKLAGSDAITSIDSSEHLHHSEDPALYMKRALADICRALDEGTPTRIDAGEALRGLEIMMHIYESAKRGTVIHLRSEPGSGS